MSGSHHSRSCSPAYRLQGPTSRLLNQLCHLGEGTLIARQQGLSLAKVTSFGLCVANECAGWNRLRDEISGLESDLDVPHHVYLLADPEDGRPVLATSAPGGEIDLSIHLDHHQWDSRAIRQMIGDFGGILVDSGESKTLRAGAWLDDWLSTSPPGMGIRWEIILALDACKLMEVEVDTGAHRGRASFRPAFLDSEGAVLRIADATRKHVVFADAGSPYFRWSSDGPGHMKIRMERVDRSVSLAMSAA